ncbi:MAG: thioredoxin domain-containing protein [Candidatus Micrarchaeota archaeon]
MVLCIIGLVVFGVLGIFSAKYRSLAKEAFECVFRMAQLKPCQGGLDDRLRRGILSRTFKISPILTKYVNKYFELLSWLFVALFLISTFFIIQGLYNYALYGNCNGPDSNAFCIFDPLGSNQPHENECLVPGLSNNTLMAPSDLGSHIIGPIDAKITLIEVGCYTCPYTKQAQPNVGEIRKKYGDKIRFVFKPFPLPSHNFSMESSEAAECAADQGKFWEYHQALFDNQEKVRSGGISSLTELARQLGLNEGSFNVCLIDGKYKTEIEKSFGEGVAEGIYGTPTFFINGRPIIGPSSVNELSRIIDEELAK